jgi:hypothetical protein
VPDTEISLLTDASGLWVEAIQIESPEPLPWQRIWQWIRLTNSSGESVFILPLWNADGTRGLLVPFQQLAGNYDINISFQGNIGPEAPCITQNGSSLTESLPLGTVTMGPAYVRISGNFEGHPILSQRLQIQPILEALGHR